MLRVRAASFFTGFAVASGMAMYQVQKEVWSSHQTLSAQFPAAMSTLGQSSCGPALQRSNPPLSGKLLSSIVNQEC
ncbi:hypothetical protein AXG93_3137s1000 [Marchantia polymorpha subsp. ruderalis]|uniref:HIG1 domain-containing protein n=1 Tax=Marchantia polymorpha subsp. ruderalis TaxID=1480154 RepID=A0A176W3Q6_MARPO|nr:hypothetical protein AXG93_3137s1000 [Marchantia polymorpha subsp. ruderalis]